jgi:hypothetical protein
MVASYENGTYGAKVAKAKVAAGLRTIETQGHYS